MHGSGGMSTVFSANQITGGVTRPVVMKRSDIDQQAAFQRESRVLQCLSAPGRVTAGFVIQLLETYSTSEHNFIVMEKAGINLSGRVKESRRLSMPERTSQLQLWGVQACQVRVLLWRAVKACIFSEDGRDVNGGNSMRHSSANFVLVHIAFALSDGTRVPTLPFIWTIQVVVALHDLGVVWGDVKPDNFVFRQDRLVAVDFGSTCVEVGSIAQQQLGADAETSFTPTPSDQFAWSVQYAAPERARNEGKGRPCVARRSQVCLVANIQTE